MWFRHNSCDQVSNLGSSRLKVFLLQARFKSSCLKNILYSAEIPHCCLYYSTFAARVVVVPHGNIKCPSITSSFLKWKGCPSLLPALLPSSGIFVELQNARTVSIYHHSVVDASQHEPVHLQGANSRTHIGHLSPAFPKDNWRSCKTQDHPCEITTKHATLRLARSTGCAAQLGISTPAS